MNSLLLQNSASDISQENYPHALNTCLGPHMLNIYLTCEKICEDTHMLDMCIFYMFNTCLINL